MLNKPPGKLLDKASLTRLDTELGPRGKRDPEFWLFCAFEFIIAPALFEFELELFVVETDPKVRLLARAANVSKRPAAAVGSIWLLASVEVRLGTLTLIGFVTTMGQLLLFLALLDSFLQLSFACASVVEIFLTGFSSSVSEFAETDILTPAKYNYNDSKTIIKMQEYFSTKLL